VKVSYEAQQTDRDFLANRPLKRTTDFDRRTSTTVSPTPYAAFPSFEEPRSI